MTLLAVDDGLAQGNLDWADICFLAAAIILVVVAVFAWVRGRNIEAGLSPIALALVAFGLFLL